MSGRGLDTLARRLEEIRSHLAFSTEAEADRLRVYSEERQPSAQNLLHYLTLRRRDIRDLQDELAALGLSSLGRTEAHVLHSIDAVLAALNRLRGLEPARIGPAPPVGFAQGKLRLERNTDALLGPPRPSRRVRIMVTMPKEAASDYALVRELVARGMDIMRINCAHDREADWGLMIELLRRAERDVGRPCRALMDLAGPKLRTGAIATSEPVVRFRPRRNALGKPIAPARVWLSPAETRPPAPIDADASVPVAEAWLGALRTGDSIRFTDARGARRALKVVGQSGPGRLAETMQSCYVTRGTELKNERTRKNATVGALAPSEEPLVLRPGDLLLVTRGAAPGRAATRDDAGRALTPATVPCSLPEVFGSVRPGERIWLDDGKIGGVIRDVSPDQIQVEITQAREKGEKLRSDKGINLPDSDLSALPAMTAKDIRDLEFVAKHADLIGMSFVHRPEDIEQLRERLEAFGAVDKGVVLKIETRNAFEALPDLLLAALRLPAAGVMIARGDLLVECGYERLAEVQEEILWLCEAAHVPVIWATQVLETLAQKGIPSRAEITDAAMGERAECVMLNKGPHIIDAVTALDSILRRMQAHQSKKSPRLRRLHF
jgi:pyruvate kinase